MILITIYGNLFLCSQRPGSSMVMCLVQRLLGLQSNSLNVTSHIFRFDNYYLRLIKIDDYMQFLAPK